MARAVLSSDEEAQMRERLCDAALALYHQSGPEAVTFRRLAEALGVSHTQPYRYFASKEALFNALRLRCVRQFSARMYDNDPGGSDAARRLRAIYEALLVYVRDHASEYRLMFSLRQPALEDCPELLSARREAFDHLVAIAQQAQAQGRLAGDARTQMHVAWGAVHGVLSLHAANQLVHGRTLDELVEPILRTVLAPLFTEEATSTEQAIDASERVCAGY